MCPNIYLPRFIAFVSVLLYDPGVAFDTVRLAAFGRHHMKSNLVKPLVFLKA